MTIIPKKLIMFDLDGTLAISKQPLDEEMAGLLRELLKRYKVAVISGGSLNQFKVQFVASLNAGSEIDNLILMPTTGAALYEHKHGELANVYAHTLSEEVKKNIIFHLEEAIVRFNLKPEQQFGDLIEDRGTQITYSGLGQKAPIELKSTWDPDISKRKQVIEYLKGFVSGVSMKTGGPTSIDITQEGIDKGFGVHEVCKYLGIGLSDVVFVGDALYPGGNDEAAKSTGVDCVEVKSVDDTKNYIRSIL